MTELIIENMNRWIHQNNAEPIDCIEGSLLDNVVYSCRRGTAFIYETYQNTWTSKYTCYFVPYTETEEENTQWEKWEKFRETTEAAWKPKKIKYPYEIRQVECWNYDGNWTVNESWLIGKMETSGNEKRAFIRFLNKNGIYFKKNRTLIDFDGDLYTVIDRKTKEPLFMAIPNY